MHHGHHDDGATYIYIYIYIIMLKARPCCSRGARTGLAWLPDISAPKRWAWINPTIGHDLCAACPYGRSTPLWVIGHSGGLIYLIGLWRAPGQWWPPRQRCGGTRYRPFSLAYLVSRHCPNFWSQAFQDWSKLDYRCPSPLWAPPHNCLSYPMIFHCWSRPDQMTGFSRVCSTR